MADITTVEEYRDTDKFMEIVDVDLFNTIFDMYTNGEISTLKSPLPLRVIRSKGVNVEPDFDIKVTDLNTNKSNVKYKQFTNTGNGGISFKVDVIIKKSDAWGYGIKSNADYLGKDKQYTDKAWKTWWLNYWFTHMRPLYVVSNAIDVPNGVYLITKNNKREQTLDRYTVWTLEFTTFNPLTLHTWDVAKSVSDALNPKKTTTTTTTSTTKATELSKCTASNIVYSKTEKKTDCNKLMQEKLYKLGFLRQDQVDGWYGDVTMEAVKKFQKWYNKKGHNLLVDGICGAVTLKALISS